MGYIRTYFSTNPASSELPWNICKVEPSAPSLGSGLFPPGSRLPGTGYCFSKTMRFRRVYSFSSKLKGLYKGIGHYYQRQRVRDEGGPSGGPPGVGDLRGPDQGPRSNGEHLQR